MFEAITYIGLLGAIMTTSCFIPQAYKIWKTKHTKDISLHMYAILSAGLLTWLVYGIAVTDVPLIAANAVSLMLSLFILACKARFG